MAIEIHVLEIQEKVAFDEDRTRDLYIRSDLEKVVLLFASGTDNRS